MNGPRLPRVVAHADWSVDPRKRWCTIARRGADGGYRAEAPRPVGKADGFLAALAREARPSGGIFVGFDFPLGLPAAYAKFAGVEGFSDLLPRLGQGEWEAFFDVATTRADIGPHRPFYPKGPVKKGGARQDWLVAALGLSDRTELSRPCDFATNTRRAACPMFWTMGANQVGKAMIAGWRDCLQPALRDPGLDLALWPFDGPLFELLGRHRIVVAETYPGECYGHLKVAFPRPRSGAPTGKRVQASRAGNAGALLAWAGDARVGLEPDLVDAIHGGFGGDSAGEDRFDATIGLLGMLNVVLGRRPPGDPASPVARAIEGWILGQTYPSAG